MDSQLQELRETQLMRDLGKRRTLNHQGICSVATQLIALQNAASAFC